MKFYSLGCSTVKDFSAGVCDLQDYYNIIDQYQTLGVRQIEYSHPQSMSKEDAAKIERYSSRRGLTAWSVHGMPWGGEWTGEKFEAQFRHDAEIAKILHAHVIVFHIVKKNEDGSIRWDVYDLVARIAKENDLELAIETGTAPRGETVLYTELIELVDKINQPHVGINIDTGHSYLRDTKNVEEVINAVGARLKTLHLHDNYGERDDHQAPGMGYIDWYKVIPALKASPYDGPLMLEMTDVKKHRTVSQLCEMTIDREILLADSLFRHIFFQ